MAIRLSDDTIKRLHASIRRYFAEELDHEIGDLKAGLVLDFFLKEMGPSVYNRAIADARTYFEQRAADLEGVCYQQELSYWQPASKPPAGRRG